MADQPKPKIKRWVYPFLRQDGKEIDDPTVFFQALAAAKDGSYPIGDNGLWHGGVHFDNGSASKLAQDKGVRCIADGEVVAYRIDDAYPQIDYPEGKKALYSTGFVLVRHRLELPPPPQTSSPATAPPATNTPPSSPAPQTPAAPAPAPGEQPALTIFSLYMHVLNWDTYKAELARIRPTYWGGTGNTYRAGVKAKDKNETLAPGKTGLNIRDAGGAVIGLLPAGTTITTGDANPDKPGYFAIASIVSGDTLPSKTSGYVFKAELDPVGEPDAAALGAVYVLPTPKPVAAGVLMGYQGEYGRYQDATPTPPTPSRPLLHLEIFTGEDIAGFITQSQARAAQLDASQKTILLIKQGAKLCQPSAADKTLPADAKPTEMEGKDAGEGPWVRVQQTKKTVVPVSALSDPKGSGSSGSFLYQGHRVPFTGNYVNDAGETTTDKSQKATFTKREILAPDGDPLWIERSMLTSPTERKAWSKFPLQLSSASTPVADQNRSISKQQLTQLTGANKAKDETGTAWYFVDVGTASSSDDTTGWVCEKAHPQTEWKSPWDWPGFQILTETSPPAELFSRKLDSLGAAADATEAQSLKSKAQAADNGALLTQLRKAVDAQGNKDGRIDGDELRKALNKPWLAEQISKLIVKYDSEWAGPMAKWEEMDSLMLEGLPIWQEEKKRIQKLQWWEKVGAATGLPAAPLVSHFHPYGIISNFINASADCDCINDLTEAQLKFVSTTATNANITAYTPEINKMFERFNISKCINRAHIVAQLLHESGSFKYTKELGTNLSYDPWRGRGLIQITGEDNYQAYGAYVGEDITSGPSEYEKLEKLPHSVLSAGWYWVEFKNISGDADKDDFIWCTAVVNGAYNGYNDRLKYVNRFISALNISSCAKKNHDGEYLFEESKVYNNRRFSFAWGLWHDPNSSKDGVTKSKEKSIAGYQRYIDLHESAGKPVEPSVKKNGTKQYWYGIKVDSYKEYAEQRINSMKAF